MAVTAMFMALNIAVSSFGIPVPGGHFYLTDVIICTSSILLNPFCAFVVGGIGSFLGDLIFYPAAMFVSLVVHGLQAVVISLLSHRKDSDPSLAGSIAGVTIGAIIMVAGYTFGRAFIYSTPEYSIIKLPYEFLQAGFGAVVSVILIFPLKIRKIYRRLIG